MYQNPESIVRVLIVDDDPQFLKTIAKLLRQLGHDADEADCAAGALELLKFHEYDIILLDYTLKERSGAWFMKHADLPDTTHVILVSGFAPDSVVERMSGMGVCDYLEKPFSQEELMIALEANRPRTAAT